MLESTIQEKKRKALIVFDDMTAAIISKKSLNPIVLNWLLETEN